MREGPGLAISVLHGISFPPGGHGHFSACLPPATGSSLPPGPPPRPGTAVHCIQSFSVSPRILCSLASFQVAAFSSFKARGRPPRRAFSFPRKVLSLGCSGAGAASSAHRRLRLKRGVHGDTARWVWGWPVTARGGGSKPGADLPLGHIWQRLETSWWVTRGASVPAAGVGRVEAG